MAEIKERLDKVATSSKSGVKKLGAKSKTAKTAKPATNANAAKRKKIGKVAGKALGNPASKAINKKIISKNTGNKKSTTESKATSAVKSKTKAEVMTKAQVKTKVKSNSKSSLSAKNGFPEQLRDEALRVLDERQAAEVISYDMRDRSPLFDYIIIATGQSTRQVAAIAGHVVDAFEKFGAKAVRVEGLPQADWVLVDGGDVLVHIFRPEVRAFYNLESIFAASANHSAKK